MTLQTNLYDQSAKKIQDMSITLKMRLQTYYEEIDVCKTNI